MKAAGVSVAVCVAAVLAPGPAAAFVRTVTSRGQPMFWPASCVALELATGRPPPALDAATVARAARAAAATWSPPALPCAGLRLRIVDSAAVELPAALDGTSRITFRRDEWCSQPRAPDEPCHDPAALAITSVFAESASGALLDADVEVNAVGKTWGDLAAAPRPGAHDLQNTLTHELGHVIGLEHTCYQGRGVRPRDDAGNPVVDCAAAGPEIQQTTMYVSVAAGDLERRTLAEDDRRAACAIYPAAGAPQACEAFDPPDVVGGCAVGRGGGGLLLVLVSAAACWSAARASGARRRRGCTWCRRGGSRRSRA